MRKLRLYLDTTIPNFLFADDAPDLKKITEEFFSGIGSYDVYISDVVLQEIGNTSDLQKREKLLDVIEKHDIKTLPADRLEEVAKLAQHYLADGAVPVVKRADAEHIAYAVVYEMDVLVSWNYKHLANVNKEIKINNINQREGYFYPFRMMTPSGVIKDEEE